MPNKTLSDSTKKPALDTLPHNKEAEKALLGSLIIDNDAFFDISLSADSFFYHANEKIFEAISALLLNGQIADTITIADELEQGGYADIGDGERSLYAYLTHLITLPTSSMYARDYARVIKEQATRRKVILAANRMATAAWNDDNFQRVVDGAQEEFLGAVRGESGKEVRHIKSGMNQYIGDLHDKIADPNSVPGIKTGFIDLDRTLNGVKPHELVVIAARPGMGKTAMMLAMADFMSVRPLNPLTGIIFSLEMSEQELINRLVSRRTKIDSQRLDRGDLTTDEQGLVQTEGIQIAKAPLYINDSPGLSVSKMLAEATKIKMLNGLDYIMIDYLQLAEAGSRLPTYEKTSKTARDLKNLAKYLEVPTFVLSQLSRKVEDRKDKRPMLSDMRDSGQIEEAVDAALMLYRQDYYEEGVRPNIVECGVEKNRGGPMGGTVYLFFDGPTITMHNLERQPITDTVPF
jgi:replicative DNA helicase